MLGQTTGSHLNQKIEVQIREETPSAWGGENETWATSETKWGRIMGIGIAMEFRTGRWGGQRTEATHEILFRGKYNFSMGNTRFFHDDTYYIPIEPGFDPGGNSGLFTNIRCRIALEERA